MLEHLDFLIICQLQCDNKWNFKVEDGFLLTATHNVPLIEIILNINLFGEHSSELVKLISMITKRFISMNALIRKYEELIMKLLLGNYTYFWSEDQEEDEHLM